MKLALRSVSRSLLVLLVGMSCAGPDRVDGGCVEAIAGRKLSIPFLPASRIDARLRTVQSSNALRATMIENLFREAGCSDLRQLPVTGSELPNIVCSLPGSSEQRIVVGAHFDKVDEGEGAVDNWSGAALLPSLYEGMRAVERHYSYDFISFTDEEKGLVGSRAYVEQLAAPERAQIAAMVNLDSLGLGETSVEQKMSDPGLYCFFAAAAAAIGSPVQGINVDEVGTSDFLPFRKQGIPVVSIHSLTQKTLNLLHSDRDRLDAIDAPAYYESYRLLAAYLTVLDLGLPTRQ